MLDSEFAPITRPTDVTRLLHAWQAGDRAALSRLMPLIYEDLRRIARERLSRVPPGQTLSTCALVHEGYGRIAGSVLELKNRTHFMALMSRVMRNVLVDRALAKGAARRGGDELRVDPESALSVAARDESPGDLLDLHAALQKLGQLDARKEQIVEMYFFGGLSRPEIGESLSLSRSTVDRDLRLGMAWLRVAMAERVASVSPGS
ncbi:MAG: ECF-type sigma factor [Panacagrimonas sp.]